MGPAADQSLTPGQRGAEDALADETVEGGDRRWVPVGESVRHLGLDHGADQHVRGVGRVVDGFLLRGPLDDERPGDPDHEHDQQGGGRDAEQDAGRAEAAPPAVGRSTGARVRATPDPRPPPPRAGESVRSRVAGSVVGPTGGRPAPKASGAGVVRRRRGGRARARPGSGAHVGVHPRPDDDPDETDGPELPNVETRGRPAPGERRPESSPGSLPPLACSDDRDEEPDEEPDDGAGRAGSAEGRGGSATLSAGAAPPSARPAREPPPGPSRPRPGPAGAAAPARTG